LISSTGTNPGISGNRYNGVWNGFLGHPRTARILESAARRPTGPYLFVGAPGAGHKSAARLFAAAVICPDACGICNVCSRVIRGIHPDVSVFQPEGYTYPVEVLRAGVVAAAQTPIEASHRLFILEEADRITERSQNALLKALEEPAPSVVWILVADSVHNFLPTILSRCQMIDFPPITEEALTELLESKFALGESEAARIVHASRGDMDAAVRLAEEPLVKELRRRAFAIASSSHPTLTELLAAADGVLTLSAQARRAAEEIQAGELHKWSGHTTGWRGATALQRRIASTSKRTLRRVESEVMVDFLAWLGAAFRDLTLASEGGKLEELTGPEFAEDLFRSAATRPPKFWVDMVEVCLEAQLAIRSNANAALVLESVLLRLL
jgi:DNA polymerase III subunit delta'